jgi:pyridoxine 5-phosphate synthase
VRVRLNLEMSVAPEIVTFALQTRPEQVTLVPERRTELTTEGGLDVAGQFDRVAPVVERCRDAGLEVSLFIDPDPAQVEAAHRAGAKAVELHTGRYADAPTPRDQARELGALAIAGAETIARGLGLHAGHGLNYQNVGPVALIDGMLELNIGHSIVSRAVLVGMDAAIREMKTCMAHV